MPSNEEAPWPLPADGFPANPGLTWANICRTGGLVVSGAHLTTWSSVRWSAASSEAVDPGLATVFEALVHEHPLVNYYAVTGDGGPIRFSDRVTRRELRGLALYQEFFRPLGVDHQMAIRMAYAPGPSIGIAPNRCGTDFSDRERALLGVLREPLAGALRRVRAHEGEPQSRGVVDPASASDLTRREVEVLRYAATGRTNTAVAHVLDIGPRTVAKHLEHAYRKLGVSSRTAAVSMLTVRSEGSARTQRCV